MYQVRTIQRVIVLVIVGLFLVGIHSVSAAAKDTVKSGLQKTYAETGETLLSANGNSLPQLVGRGIGAILGVLSVLFFVLVLLGALIWMTARGNQERVTKGRDTIFAATIGLVIILGSYGVTRFVLRSVRSSEQLQPANICSSDSIGGCGGVAQGGTCRLPPDLLGRCEASDIRDRVGRTICSCEP